MSSVASLKHLSAGRWPVASVRPNLTSQTETATEQARTGRGGEVRPGRVVGSSAAGLSSAAMAALLSVQERRDSDHVRDRAGDVLGDIRDRLADRWEEHRGRKKPKPPKPHDPPPPAPSEPPPVVTPPPVTVVDDPAPARFLQSVLDGLREAPERAVPDVPFSKRQAAQAPAAPAGLGAFYTPGVFTQAQAGAMRTASQAQAGLVLLQAAQMQAYGAAPANPFRINAFA